MKRSVSIEEARKAYEYYIDNVFYDGLVSLKDDWSDEKNTYKDFAHHLGWCIWRDIVEGGLYD